MSDEIPQSASTEEGGAPAWMATMADMFSLLLTFFVLLLSFANTDVVKFRMMLGSVRDAFGVQTPHPGDIMARATTPIEFSDSESTAHLDVFEVPTPSESQGKAEAKSSEMKEEFDEAVEDLGLGRMIEVVGTKRGLVVRVKGQLLFDPGSEKLRPESFVFLDEIARLTRIFSHPLSVEGHSDDGAIQTARFPSNWDLSAARAISAVRYLIDARQLEPTLLSATGYGPTRPLVANDSAEHRAQNRRIEFVYLNEPPETPELLDDPI